MRIVAYSDSGDGWAAGFRRVVPRPDDPVLRPRVCFSGGVELSASGVAACSAWSIPDDSATGGSAGETSSGAPSPSGVEGSASSTVAAFLVTVRRLARVRERPFAARLAGRLVVGFAPSAAPVSPVAGIIPVLMRCTKSSPA